MELFFCAFGMVDYCRDDRAASTDTRAGARSVGAAAVIAEDQDGGRVFVHGNLAYAWTDPTTLSASPPTT
jgi:hypothetical protein